MPITTQIAKKDGWLEVICASAKKCNTRSMN
ncbi:unnamed protein product [Soboliphyme baturini]|uniref:50S ribosomal protein L23 n=1 Tax=Soboliphyme baturini TaxID=241478 RepID=A0A183IJW6_9BILA|nr:unnamed protein product [Soboliphyme baturini]